MRFQDIPQFPRAHWQVDCSWLSIDQHLEMFAGGDCVLEMEPDFQRAHVWTTEQQIAYVEYMLRGGEVGREIIFNGAGWPHDDGLIQLVDGKQRLQSVQMFLADELQVFGLLYSEYEGLIRWHIQTFKFKVTALKTREEILQLYLNINAGGTPHTAEELARVRKLLEDSRK